MTGRSIATRRSRPSGVGDDDGIGLDRPDDAGSHAIARTDDLAVDNGHAPAAGKQNAASPRGAGCADATGRPAAGWRCLANGSRVHSGAVIDVDGLESRRRRGAIVSGR